jgi:hypothetical protein
MLYIGHFSFDETSPDEALRHGYFTCIVDKNNVDTAIDQFRSLIEKSKTEKNSFANIVAVYIEDIFEIKKIPKTAKILRIQSSVGEFPKSLTRTLPFVETDDINAFGWAPDIRKIRTAEKNEVLEMEPFLRFV